MDPIDLIFNRLLRGVDPITVIAILSFVSIICRFIGKVIPDNATGWRGLVRKVAKIVGLYTSNRITSTQTQEEMVVNARNTARAAAETATQAVVTVESVAASSDCLSNSELGVGERGFVHAGLLWIIGLLGGLLLLTGCAASQVRLGADVICSNAETAQRLLDEAQASNRKDRIQRILNTIKTVCPFISLTV